MPAAIADAGEHATRRFIEFFTATIRNPNTRAAYAQAVAQFFRWYDRRGLAGLSGIEPIVVAAYIEDLGHLRSKPTVKQPLAAIRMLLDWLVTGGVMSHNPAASVRGPRYSVSRGKTPVLSAEQARHLLDSIRLERREGKPDLAGLRDRALIGVMVYSFSRVSAAAAMRLEDYYAEGKRWWLRLHEKGGKLHHVPAHHNVEAYLDSWIRAAAFGAVPRTPQFPTITPGRGLTDRAMTRSDVLRMIKRRAQAAGVPVSTCCHTYRATGITTYMSSGGTLENAQAIAAHESARTTKLYDRTSDEITLDEIERILI